MNYIFIKLFLFMRNIPKWDQSIDEGRRKFLWMTAFLTVSALVTWIGSASADVLNLDPSIEKSRNNIGENEWDFLQSMYSLSNQADIQSLQKDTLKLSDADWVIGPKTLAQIYIQIYSQLDYLPRFQSDRLAVYHMLQKYSEVQNGRRPTGFSWSIEDMARLAFRWDKYFGWNSLSQNEPLKNTHINKQLYAKFQGGEEPDILRDKDGEMYKNTIFIERYEGEDILSIYGSDGKLALLTLVSPGTSGHRSHPSSTSSIGVLGNPNHVSSAYPEDSPNGKGGYPMPFSTETYNTQYPWERIHGSIDIVNGQPQSHGCVRVPLGYAQWVYEYIKANRPNVRFWNLY